MYIKYSVHCTAPFPGHPLDPPSIPQVSFSPLHYLHNPCCGSSTETAQLVFPNKKNPTSAHNSFLVNSPNNNKPNPYHPLSSVKQTCTTKKHPDVKTVHLYTVSLMYVEIRVQHSKCQNFYLHHHRHVIAHTSTQLPMHGGLNGRKGSSVMVNRTTDEKKILTLTKKGVNDAHCDVSSHWDVGLEGAVVQFSHL